MTRWVVFLLVPLIGACRNTAPPPETRPAEPPVETSTTSPTSWDPWEEARSRGIEFRALGNEPGWFLEIDQEKWMRLLYAYGERMATTPVPKPTVDGGVTRYQSSGDGHTLDVKISGGPCSDGMSDQTYPLTVTVAIDGTDLRGCGRWLNR
jgi:putative lipoprotein